MSKRYSRVSGNKRESAVEEVYAPLFMTLEAVPGGWILDGDSIRHASLTVDRRGSARCCPMSAPYACMGEVTSNAAYEAFAERYGLTPTQVAHVTMAADEPAPPEPWLRKRLLEICKPDKV